MIDVSLLQYRGIQGDMVILNMKKHVAEQVKWGMSGPLVPLVCMTLAVGRLRHYLECVSSQYHTYLSSLI